MPTPAEMWKDVLDASETKGRTVNERVKNLFYSWDHERQLMLRMQQCQRNWDYSKSIHPEVIDHLLWVAQNVPTKQHEAYYDVYWSADRKVVSELAKNTWGHTYSRNPPATWRNAQANANMYMVFVAKAPPTMYNCNNDGTPKKANDWARWENAIVAVGMALGMVMRSAHEMGLWTGCNKSNGQGPDCDYEWEKRFGIYDDVVAGTKKIYYGIGIGYPQEGRPRWETDETELCIGAANGSNLTLKEGDHFDAITGRKLRQCKIVDIRTTDKAVDPYGNIHHLPEIGSHKINTVHPRDIKCIEIT